jgi:ABC-type antimicrobial peptide transport system permease subunit
MTVYFFKIAWRNLLRSKSFSFINISGLAIGMAAAILILLWIQKEVSYDKFHNKKERIFGVWNRYKIDGKVGCWNNTPKVMAAAIQQDYPEIEKTARINFFPPVLMALGEKKLTGRGKIVDSSFLQIFSFPILKGNAKTPLKGMFDIILTEKLAKNFFGNEEAIGKIIRLDNTDNFTVTAVIKDPPDNTKFEFEFLIGWAYMRYKGWDDNYWGNNSIDTYVLLKSASSLASIEPKIKNLRARYDKSDPSIETFLYPLTREHLYGTFENGKESGGRIEIVKLFGIIAAFILLIACINFMNLSTARSEKRAKEVGVRKVVGAQKQSLIFQFLGESVLLAFIAGMIALLIVQFALPAFNELVDKKLFIDFNSLGFWLAGIAFILVTGLLAGSYPAIYLSSFRPIMVLKGSLKAVNALVTPRKVLVIAQFTFAIVLIIATIIVRQQIQNAQERQAGYSKDNLVYHFMEGEVEKNYTLIKNELLANGAAISVTKTSAPITEGWSNTWGIEWQGKNPKDKTLINRFCADDAIVKTIGLQLVAGRDFDLTNFPTDSSAAIINESAVKIMGFKDPIGQVLKDNDKEDWHVIGVIKDFILTSPYMPVEPIFIAGAKAWFNVIHIKLNGKNTTEKNVALLKEVFKKYNPQYEFNYRFVDEEYAKKFNDEKRTSTLATLFALLTIIISCLGLFGLSSYMAENRVKEIGVRKVLGASVRNITVLLSKDFLKLVLISFVIASPLAYWAMYNWLQPFSYRVTIHWWVFALAGLSAVFIALFTVSYEAIKAAIANPVKSLRTE